MSLLKFCQLKNCGKEMEPMIDPDTEEVFCSACGQVMEGINYFTKMSLKTLGQYKRAKNPEEAYAIPCNACKTTARPVIENDKVVCAKCKQEHKLAPVFAQMLKSNLRKN